MKFLKWFFFLGFVSISFAAASAKNDCQARMFRILEMIGQAEICHHDNECMITQDFTDKLVCGKNRAINRKANIKKIIAEIDNFQGCPQGGSCHHQEANETLKVKCINDRCQILKK